MILISDPIFLSEVPILGLFPRFQHAIKSSIKIVYMAKL